MITDFRWDSNVKHVQQTWTKFCIWFGSVSESFDLARLMTQWHNKTWFKSAHDSKWILGIWFESTHDSKASRISWLKTISRILIPIDSWLKKLSGILIRIKSWLNDRINCWFRWPFSASTQSRWLFWGAFTKFCWDVFWGYHQILLTFFGLSLNFVDLFSINNTSFCSESNGEHAGQSLVTTIYTFLDILI